MQRRPKRKDLPTLRRCSNASRAWKEHNIVFNYLYEAFSGGTLYKRDKPTLWVCSECGYRATSNEAWHICPLCKASQGFVEIHLPFDNK